MNEILLNGEAVSGANVTGTDKSDDIEITDNEKIAGTVSVDAGAGNDTTYINHNRDEDAPSAPSLYKINGGDGADMVVISGTAQTGLKDYQKHVEGDKTILSFKDSSGTTHVFAELTGVEHIKYDGGAGLQDIKAATPVAGTRVDPAQER